MLRYIVFQPRSQGFSLAWRWVGEKPWERGWLSLIYRNWTICFYLICICSMMDIHQSSELKYAMSVLSNLVKIIISVSRWNVLRFLRKTGLKAIRLHLNIKHTGPSSDYPRNLLTGGCDLLIWMMTPELIFLCFFEFEHKNQIDTPFAFKGRPSFHLKKIKLIVVFQKIWTHRLKIYCRDLLWCR